MNTHAPSWAFGRNRENGTGAHRGNRGRDRRRSHGFAGNAHGQKELPRYKHCAVEDRHSRADIEFGGKFDVATEASFDKLATRGAI